MPRAFRTTRPTLLTPPHPYRVPTPFLLVLRRNFGVNRTYSFVACLDMSTVLTDYNTLFERSERCSYSLLLLGQLLSIAVLQRWSRRCLAQKKSLHFSGASFSAFPAIICRFRISTVFTAHLALRHACLSPSDSFVSCLVLSWCLVLSSIISSRKHPVFVCRSSHILHLLIYFFAILVSMVSTREARFCEQRCGRKKEFAFRAASRRFSSLRLLQPVLRLPPLEQQLPYC